MSEAATTAAVKTGPAPADKPAAKPKAGPGKGSAAASGWPKWRRRLWRTLVTLVLAVLIRSEAHV